MPRYVTLINWTEQGIAGFKESVDRYEATQKQFEELGVQLVDVYWTLGEHDIVALVEAPDDESATAALLMLGSAGNVRTKTMRAFSREEMRGVIDKAS
ncbi:MAG TPA: GYD domain-containing protein [Solirubrobacterales bacterium]|nr:GYD domain-containing protein [Solirubrobacterales bacterium]